jgi:hypothetical protein
MQFIADGPDVPEKLIQAHEEGRVVFFCGAGISYPAGLSGFKGLVEDIYAHLGTSREPIEDETFQRGQYDATLDLLERRYPGQRLAIRKALEKSLTPDYSLEGATTTHESLLKLARNRSGELRLVTTNFDQVFEYAAEESQLSFDSYSAPMLPIPKNSRWNGLVYLHGLLQSDDVALQRLVVTSGDFGLAYLNERWAARFVSELFRNYIICFVGYSINDPVLRYMMDALAADRMQGEVTPQAYAFGDFEPGEESQKKIEWEAKGVTPVLYNVPTGSHDHTALHKTLSIWSDIYKVGSIGKEGIITSHALTKPSSSTQQDDFVGRVLWALSDSSGLPAKLFADYSPAPTLDWLEYFTDKRYQFDDLERFGVQGYAPNEDLKFSLLDRPSAHGHSPWMSLTPNQAVAGKWDKVMFHIARWLIRYLNSPKFLLWLVQYSSHLHDQWVYLIESKLNEVESDGSVDSGYNGAADAAPGPLMKALWGLLLARRIRLSPSLYSSYSWLDRFNQEGLTFPLRLALRDLLTPKVELRSAYSSARATESLTERAKINEVFSWEVVLSTDDISAFIDDSEDRSWVVALPELLDDFQSLLIDALEIMKSLGDAEERSDRSYWDLPSISPHWQNRSYHEWTTLIELVRDSWLGLLKEDCDQAKKVAVNWFDLPYAVFKRLALFSACKCEQIESFMWVNWLVVDGGWWLWSTETQRETMRLIVLKGRLLSKTGKRKLEVAILAGPPRAMFRKDLTAEDWVNLVDRSTWLLLAKLKEGGVEFKIAATKDRFDQLTDKYPEWKMQNNEKDEFSHWMSGTGDPDYEEQREIDIPPTDRKGLINWLKTPVKERKIHYEDTWRATCKSRFDLTYFALRYLARDDFWPVERWRDALFAWSDDSLRERSARRVLLLISKMPVKIKLEVEYSLTWWLERISKVPSLNKKVFFEQCNQILESPRKVVVNKEYSVSSAINHSIGHITQSLLNLWFIDKPNDHDGLSEPFKSLFTSLCDVENIEYRYGRIILSSQAVALYRVDSSWTEKHLLPLLNWQLNSSEAKAAWSGLLLSPRIHPTFLSAIKPYISEAANHYPELGDKQQIFASYLTHIALAKLADFPAAFFQPIIERLPPSGLLYVMESLLRSQNGAGDQKEEYWESKVLPFWKEIWPKSSNLVSSKLATYLSQLCIATGNYFPEALSEVKSWLSVIERPDYSILLLERSNLCENFPSDSLQFLSLIVNDQPYVPRQLVDCLKKIKASSSSLADTPEYTRLFEYSRSKG